jgi:hypothetical protein
MKAEPLVAILALAGSIASAAFAWWQSVRVARLNSSTTLAIEEFRAETERRRKAYELASEQAGELEKALVGAWREIQVIKEEITKLTWPAGHDLDIALENRRQPVTRLLEGYEQFGASIPVEARLAWHSAKKIASSLMEVTRQGFEAKRVLPDEVRARIQQMRFSLTDSQLCLSNVHHALREGIAQRLLKVI